MTGKYHTEETKKKISQNHANFKSEKHPQWKGGKIKFNCKICGKEKFVYPVFINHEGSNFCSSRCSAIWQMKHQKNHDTDIERLIENELIRRDIPFTKQVSLLGISIVDFLLISDTVIYCDGEYWHSRDGRKQRDANQDYMLTFYGYKVFRFTGTEIKGSAKKCIDKIKFNKQKGGSK